MSRAAVGGPRRRSLRTLLWTSSIACTLIAPTIAGAAGAQAVVCFGSPATIVGTDGPDQLRGTPGNDVVVTLGGGDTFDGTPGGNDKICTGDGDDTVVAGSGNDEIDLGADSDSVLGQQGDDNLVGGEGPDLVAFITSAVGVQVNLATGTATGAGTDRLSGFERVWGSAFGDLLTGDDRQNVFIPDVLQRLPAGSNDVIQGAGGFDFVMFEGTVRASLATGQATGEGNDRLTGIEGLFAGGAGTFVGNGGPNVFFGGRQDDVLDGAGGDDDIIGGAGNDRLSGGAGLDLIDGSAGNDAIDGGAGFGDIVMYSSSSARVQVSLATRRGRGDGADTLAGLETIVGSAFGDTLDGSRRADRLYGQAGNDRISGGGGDDYLDGGGARDRLGGGPDLDYCHDGERNSACEASGRSRTSARSARRPVQSGSATVLEGTLDVLYGLASGKPVRAPVPTGVSGPTPGLAVTANADGYIYPPYPTCEGSGSRRFTRIGPPKRLPLVGRRGEQTLTWQATLKDARGRLIFRTAVAGAVIQEEADGHVYQWDDLRSRRPYQSRRIAVAAGGAGAQRWEAEIRIEGDPAPVRHEVPPPCPLVSRP